MGTTWRQGLGVQAHTHPVVTPWWGCGHHFEERKNVVEKEGGR